ncbi:sulfate ABC transporter permease subunit CysW [Moraxella bovis]|uniref:sulfate ABC transporter permease subunit CysW n=1 Tax=Moraxella bovis TaxID=476 RepID=UPI0022265211|nr:sulfate ABC transporter permease subunit CysW [Moraxella bovis]UYZ69258.1 sulfate ABC transporter permease subunit CysW [Moraxella bovis]UYZ71632.1 sulfate ABC transporter permease subunit CysW [Moraxella bovis]UYZ72454.1 sulfate ABC transporter permease subunit CysW [Moraxella bovis]UYZ88643.1 sulfate ABC transporter permease subunit CysW [Moraxella bovis]UYZ96196.1 sulfate ABC transporter permease subunit CysW [Moraxella bovis]
MATQSTYDYQNHPATKDPAWVKYTLITLAVSFMAVMLVVPLIAVFYEALKDGVSAYLSTLTDPDALHAIKLTLITTAIILPINTVIGVALAYLITRHKFRGKFIITTLLDLPFAVSPVVAGLMFVLLFGANTLIGSFFESLGIKIIFATTGIVLATLFVTFPFIAREIIPLMQSIGDSEEEASLTLGANGWQMFWHVTLPNIKWALLYGIILTNARAMGEFGAVSVVSGHIRGETNTMPLLIEIAYNEYAFTTAFALSSLLALLALVTLGVQNVMSRKKVGRS